MTHYKPGDDITLDMGQILTFLKLVSLQGICLEIYRAVGGSHGFNDPETARAKEIVRDSIDTIWTWFQAEFPGLPDDIWVGYEGELTSAYRQGAGTLTLKLYHRDQFFAAALESGEDVSLRVMSKRWEAAFEAYKAARAQA